jgi:hypothetical protein
MNGRKYFSIYAIEDERQLPDSRKSGEIGRDSGEQSGSGVTVQPHSHGIVLSIICRVLH